MEHGKALIFRRNRTRVSWKPGAVKTLTEARGAIGGRTVPPIQRLTNAPIQTKSAVSILGRLDGRRVLQDGTRGAPRGKDAIKKSPAWREHV